MWKCTPVTVHETGSTKRLLAWGWARSKGMMLALAIHYEWSGILEGRFIQNSSATSRISSILKLVNWVTASMGTRQYPNINFRPKKCRGQSRYGRYGSYATGPTANLVIVFETFKRSHNLKTWLRFAPRRGKFCFWLATACIRSVVALWSWEIQLLTVSSDPYSYLFWYSTMP